MVVEAITERSPRPAGPQFHGPVAEGIAHVSVEGAEPGRGKGGWPQGITRARRSRDRPAELVERLGGQPRGGCHETPASGGSVDTMSPQVADRLARYSVMPSPLSG